MKRDKSRMGIAHPANYSTGMVKWSYCFFIILFLITESSFAQVTFTDVSEPAGVRGFLILFATWGDYDNDGYMDMVGLAQGTSEKKLYHNEGNGTFRDITELTGIKGNGLNPAYFLDFDNDGKLDLFMSGNNTKGTPYEHGDLLYRNMGDGTFVDVSQKAGLDPNGRPSSGGWNADIISFDYDNDGFLDIFVFNGGDITPPPNYFYHNEGNGRFKEIAVQIGLDNPRLDGVIPGDYDNDGDLDLFISVLGTLWNKPDPNDQGIDRLYHNEGNGVYVDVAKEAGVQRNKNYENGLFFDYDNDRDLDLFLRAINYGDVYGDSVLYRNNGDGTFTEVTQQAGILPIGMDTIGLDYGDYDNDGWLDLFITYSGKPGSLPSFLYHNNGDGTFTNVSRQVGINEQTGSYALANFADYDNDGNLDIFIFSSPIALYRNNGTSNHWLQLKLVGRQSNRDAIGARVKVIAGNLSMIREVAGSVNGAHAERLPVHFGLGANTKADTIEIRWPSGIIQTFTDIPADQRLTIDEAEGIVTIVRQVIPDSGYPAGGTAIRILGEGFLPGSRVLFGGVEAEHVRVETSSLITAVTPPGAKGFVDVEVANPDGKRSLLKNGFLYSTIQVTKITPESGPAKGGIQIQIEGYGFQQGAVVKIGENPLANTFVTPVLIRGTLTSSKSGTVDVSVTNPDGETVVLKSAFTYISPPKINSVYPDFGPLITSVQINISGTGFIKMPTVSVGGVAAQKVGFTSSAWLEVTISGIFKVGPQDVTVINPDGQSDVIPDGLTILAPPKIKSVEPASGSLDGGTKITITGESVVEVSGSTFPSRFVSPMRVLIGKIEALEVVVESDHVLTAITPPNTPGPKDVTVIDVVDQEDTIENAFSYNTTPQINKVIPNNGRLAGGTKITIEGNGFMPGAEVVIRTKDGAAVLASSIQVISSTMMTAITPSISIKPGACDITIINPDDQRMTFPDGFTYNPMPTITRITPDHGSSSGGTKIIIEGGGFLAGVRVAIGNKQATAQLKDSMTIEAVTPSNPQGVWDVRILNLDTQEVVKPRGFITVGELAYNYPNPFRMSQGTTFRYVSNESVQSITVKIFNLAGIPIDVVHQDNSKEVRWQNDEVHVGMYIYVMEVKLGSGETKQFKKALEVRK